MPFFIKAFGNCAEEESCSQEINQVLDVADENLVGWSYETFKFYKDPTKSESSGIYDSNGQLQTYKIKALTRPYI